MVLVRLKGRDRIDIYGPLKVDIQIRNINPIQNATSFFVSRLHIYDSLTALKVSQKYSNVLKRIKVQIYKIAQKYDFLQSAHFTNNNNYKLFIITRENITHFS